MDKFYKELDKLHSEVIEIVINRSLDYIDDLDMLDSDIESDLDNEIFDNMNQKELDDYLENIKKILKWYRESEVN